MSLKGPIVIVEDDEDDIAIMVDILDGLEVSNKVHQFNKTDEAFHYLKTTSEQPFIIICDVNLPGTNGIDFKRRIDSDDYLRQKSIPFIFYSTSVDKKSVNEAYTKMTVQGFFQKSNSYESIKQDIELIIKYWKACKHPNT